MKNEVGKNILKPLSRVKGPTIVAYTKKVESEGRWIAIIRAFIVKAKTLVFTGVKTLFLLNRAPTPTITLKRVKSA